MKVLMYEYHRFAPKVISTHQPVYARITVPRRRHKALQNRTHAPEHPAKSLPLA